MALDTFARIWNRVLGRCPAATPALARDWTNSAFRQIAEARRWSWLRRKGQILVPDSYSTGTVTVTRGSATVTGSGTTFTVGMVGRQFRVGNNVYTVSAFVSVTEVTLGELWGGATASGQSYEIYQAYYTAPSDFLSWISVYDPARAWHLNLQVTQEQLNRWDPQRSHSGNPYCVVPFTYDETTDPPLPRYELWPHPRTQTVLPVIYWSRAVDLEDAGSKLPRFVRGDAVLELALAEAARWPGTDDRPNKYFDLKLSSFHEGRAMRMVYEMERQDDEVYEQDVTYDSPMAPLPWTDTDWMQKHDNYF